LIGWPHPLLEETGKFLRSTPEQPRADDSRDRIADLHTHLHAGWDERKGKEPKESETEADVQSGPGGEHLDRHTAHKNMTKSI